MTNMQSNFSLAAVRRESMVNGLEYKDSTFCELENRPVTPPLVLPKTALFPLKLHTMLETVERNGDDHIISWLSDEKSFKVHDIDEFTDVILPQFFEQTKYKSFQRQLNMWGFVRILEGPSAGGYSHHLFLRGQEDLCKQMKRIKIKGSPEKRLKPIRCQNTRIFPPPMSSILKSVSKRSKASHNGRNRTGAFFASRMSSIAMDLFGTCQEYEESSSASEAPLYPLYDLDEDVLALEPLPLDELQFDSSDFELLGDLTSLLD